MAKLSAHGRTELARLVHPWQTAEPDSDFTDGKTYLAFMSDGKILRKKTARWKDRGDLHTWNWKVIAIAREWSKKSYEDKEKFVAIWKEQKQRQGWEECK